MLTLSLVMAKCSLKENKISISFYIMHSMSPIFFIISHFQRQVIFIISNVYFLLNYET